MITCRAIEANRQTRQLCRVHGEGQVEIVDLGGTWWGITFSAGRVLYLMSLRVSACMSRGPEVMFVWCSQYVKEKSVKTHSGR